MGEVTKKEKSSKLESGWQRRKNERGGTKGLRGADASFPILRKSTQSGFQWEIGTTVIAGGKKKNAEVGRKKEGWWGL